MTDDEWWASLPPARKAALRRWLDRDPFEYDPAQDHDTLPLATAEHA